MKDAKKPNLKGPRYRQTRVETLKKDYCDKLREDLPEFKDLSDDEIKTIIKTFNKRMWETAIDKRDGVDLPLNLGHIFIGTCPPKRSTNVDFKKSKDYLKVIEHRNWESDDYIAKIFYTNFGNRYRFKNHEIWGFKAAREFKRTVAKNYPTLWKQYVQVSPFRKVSEVYRKNSYKMYKEKETKQKLENYNELEF